MRKGIYQTKNPVIERRKRGIQLALLLLFLIYLFISYLRSNFMFTTSYYQYQSPKLPNAFDNYRIVQISDLHARRYGKGNEKLLEEIQKLKPDMVVVTGDLFSRDSRWEDAREVIREIGSLTEHRPVYYVFGNHEQDFFIEHPEKQEEAEQLIQAEKIALVNNRTVSVLRRDSSLNLAGLYEAPSFYRSRAEETDLPLSQYLGKKGEDFTILLAHNPLYFKDFKKWGAELVLSGHVHGGIIRLPFLGGLLSPESRFLPAYSKGLYQEGESSMVVSAGLGWHLAPIRLFNPQELVVVDLHSLSIH